MGLLEKHLSGKLKFPKLDHSTFYPPFGNILTFVREYDQDDWNSDFEDTYQKGDHYLIDNDLISPIYGFDLDGNYGFSTFFDKTGHRIGIKYENFYDYPEKVGGSPILIAERTVFVSADFLSDSLFRRLVEDSLDCFEKKLSELDDPALKKTYINACFTDLEATTSLYASDKDKYGYLREKMNNLLLRLCKLTYPYFQANENSKFPTLSRVFQTFNLAISSASNSELKYFSLNSQQRQQLHKILSEEYIICTIRQFEDLLNLDEVSLKVQWNGKPIEFVALLTTLYDRDILKKPTQSIKWKYWEENLEVVKWKNTQPAYSKIKQNLKEESGKQHLLKMKGLIDKALE
jgi:hypothetical protein